MNSGRNDCQRISRRVVLTGTALERGGSRYGGLRSDGAGEDSQADAKYQGKPKDDQRCDGCILFQPLNTCKVVQGEISPSGWCQLFVKKT